MKKIIFGIALFILSTTTYAQAFGDGANIISVGFGLPPGQNINQQYDPYKNFINYRFYNYGTVVLKYEHGFHKYFGCGVNLEYSNTSANFQYDDISNSLRYQRKISSNIIGAYLRMNGHFPIKDRFDIYGGFGLGYLYTINGYTDSNPNANINSQQNSKILNFNFQATLGLRYMIKPGFGLFGEIGYATTVCQLGFAFKF